ncbi:MAG: DUF192 domain-containing protein [Candidatus Methanoperedens sp.]|nr:DUF192 domain-containing protein [Candidatus Methanoperedens sp.]
MLPVLKYDGVMIANNIEFARTMAKQAIGLMFRRSILPDYSMIFILKKPSGVNVHMFFVFFPIDVIFLNNEKKVMGFSGLKPWVGYKAMKDIKYVLEMKAGTIVKFNLSIGGQMEFDENLNR